MKNGGMAPPHLNSTAIDYNGGSFKEIVLWNFKLVSKYFFKFFNEINPKL